MSTELVVQADLLSLRAIGPWIEKTLEQTDDPEAEALAPRMELAIQEICVNIVKYAYDNHDDALIRIDCDIEQASYHFAIHDAGSPYDPARRPEVNFDHPSVGGYGLFLVESLCSTMHYERINNENRWTLTFPRTAQVAA